MATSRCKGGPPHDWIVHALQAQSPSLSAHNRLSYEQKCTFGLLIAFALGVAMVAPWALLVALNLFFLLHFLGILVLRAVLLMLSVRQPREPLPVVPLSDDELPHITILCPVYREAESLPNLIDALLELDYPEQKLDIKLLLEADDHQTIAVARRKAVAPMFDIIIAPDIGPKTKPKACNIGLWHARGDLLVIYDAEDRPERDQLRKAAGSFAGLPQDIVCLQARLNYYRRNQTLITRMFAIEYALLFDLVLPGLARIGAPLPLGGTSNFFRTRVLREVGGWDAYNVTEDADLGLRLARLGYRSAVLDSTTYEDPVKRLAPWIRQRSRWIKGYIQTWFVHSRSNSGDGLVKRGKGIPFRISLHLVVGSVIISSLINPIYWMLYIAWLLGAAPWAESLFPFPLDLLATMCLLAGNFFHLWLFMLAPLRREWHDLVPYGLLAPFYWILQSVAGYKALWQFISKPFYWEKTNHGAGLAASTLFDASAKPSRQATAHSPDIVPIQ